MQAHNPGAAGKDRKKPGSRFVHRHAACTKAHLALGRFHPPARKAFPFNYRIDLLVRNSAWIEEVGIPMIIKLHTLISDKIPANSLTCARIITIFSVIDG